MHADRKQTHLDKQKAKASTVDNDLTKFKRRCLTIWLASVGRTTGSIALKETEPLSVNLENIFNGKQRND